MHCLLVVEIMFMARETVVLHNKLVYISLYYGIMMIEPIYLIVQPTRGFDCTQRKTEKLLWGDYETDQYR